MLRFMKTIRYVRNCFLMLLPIRVRRRTRILSQSGGVIRVVRKPSVSRQSFDNIASICSTCKRRDMCVVCKFCGAAMFDLTASRKWGAQYARS